MSGVFNADQVALFEAKETTYATPPSAPLNPVRMTSESFKRDSDFTESAELAPDAQVTDQTRVAVTASGTIGYELSHGSQERLIASIFRQEAFTPEGNVLTLTGDGVADLDFAAADQSVSRDSGSFITDGWEIGMRASVVDSTSNDGSYVVAKVEATKLTFAAGSGIVDEANVAATVRSGALLTATTLSFADSDNSVNDSGNGFVDAGFVAGQWFTASGTTSNNLLFKIVSVTAGKMVLSHATVTTESSGASMTLTTERQVTNGTRLPTHSFERRYNEAVADADKYVRFVGQSLNTMSLNVTPGSVVSGEFGCSGSDEVDGGGATFGSSDVAATTTKVYNAAGNVSAVYENGAVFKVTNFTLEINNNVEALTEVSDEGAACNAAGRFTLGGTVTIFYRDTAGKAFYDKYLSSSPETSFALVFEDAAGNKDVLDIPRAILNDGARGAQGTNTRIQGVFSFGAAKDATEGVTARWVSIDA